MDWNQLPHVSDDYFTAMSIPVSQGRGFNDRDTQTSTPVIVINQVLAQNDFAGENPIGQRITFGGVTPQQQPVWFEIVGVSANVRSLELREAPEAELYFSARQSFGTCRRRSSSVEPTV